MAEKEYIERGIVLKAFTHRVSELTDEPIVIGMNEALSIAEEFVMSVPSANVAPVRHGHWTKSKSIFCGDYEFRCSSCGETFWEGDNYATRAHFCPNCGARMDGDNNERP